MMQRISLSLLVCTVVGCTTSYNAKAPNGSLPFGETVRAPFREMVANMSPTETVVGSVYFEFDDTSLTNETKTRLDRVARDVQNCPGTLVVEGHTDHVNSDDYNVRLGLKRALAVADYLRSAGVWDERMRIQTFGEIRPTASNWSDGGRAENRRVTIRLVNGGFGMEGGEAVKAHDGLTKSECSQEESPIQLLFQSMGGATEE